MINNCIFVNEQNACFCLYEVNKSLVEDVEDFLVFVSVSCDCICFLCTFSFEMDAKIALEIHSILGVVHSHPAYHHTMSVQDAKYTLDFQCYFSNHLNIPANIRADCAVRKRYKSLTGLSSLVPGSSTSALSST